MNLRGNRLMLFWSLGKKLVIGMLLFYILVSFFWIVDNVEPHITDEKSLESMWQHSQYNLNSSFEFGGDMYDKELYTYAAVIYSRGADPSVVNPEAPPLGKYWLGYWYRLTGNIMTGQWVALGIVVLLLWLVSGWFEIGLISRLIGLAIFLTDRLVREYGVYVHLEWLVLMFSGMGLVGVRYYLKEEKQVWLLIAGVGAGGLMMTKFFVLGGLLLSWLIGLVVWVKRRKSFAPSAGLVGIVGSVVILSYSRFFILHSIMDFVKLQIANVRLYKSYLPDYPWFEIWRVLFWGKWRTWFADPLIQPVKTYWVFWPISFVLSVLGLGMKKVKKFRLDYVIILGWVLAYLAFSSTHLVFVNYLLVVLPWMYVLSMVVIEKAMTNLFESRNWLSGKKSLLFE